MHEVTSLNFRIKLRFLVLRLKIVFFFVLFVWRIFFLGLDFLGRNCFNYKPGQGICRHFHVLVQFPFTTSETDLDYYQKKVNVRVASRVAERFKTEYLRKSGNFEKIMLLR